MASDRWMVLSLSPQSVPNLIHPAGTAALQRYLPHEQRVSVACGYALSLRDGINAMITNVKTFIIHAWNFVFDHNVSPLRHIPDVSVRHYVLQVLGLMWAVSFSVAIGSYTFLAASILGHSVLIAAAAVTVATFTVAAKRPKLFMRGAGRRSDGEHD